jgi:hypothetical protein
VDSVGDWDPGYLISIRRKEKILNFHFFEELDVLYMEGLLRFVLENWERKSDSADCLDMGQDQDHMNLFPLSIILVEELKERKKPVS